MNLHSYQYFPEINESQKVFKLSKGHTALGMELGLGVSGLVQPIILGGEDQ